MFDHLEKHGNTNWTAKYLVILAVLTCWSDAQQLTSAFKKAAKLSDRIYQCVAVGTFQVMMRALATYLPKLLPMIWARLHQLMENLSDERFRMGGWVSVAAALRAVRDSMNNWLEPSAGDESLTCQLQRALVDSYDRRSKKQARYQPKYKDKPKVTKPVVVWERRGSYSVPQACEPSANQAPATDRLQQSHAQPERELHQRKRR